MEKSRIVTFLFVFLVTERAEVPVKPMVVPEVKQRGGAPGEPFKPHLTAGHL